MSNAFAMDRDRNRVEDLTEHTEINSLIQKGKRVRILFEIQQNYNNHIINIVPSCDEIHTLGEEG